MLSIQEVLGNCTCWVTMDTTFPTITHPQNPLQEKHNLACEQEGIKYFNLKSGQMELHPMLNTDGPVEVAGVKAENQGG